MRRSTDFSRVVRSGSRARRGSLVVHQAMIVDTSTLGPRPDPAPLVGLIVGRTVGSSVVRHRVSRRLRAQLSGRLDRLPPGSGTVVRALPAAATADSVQLAADLDAALRRVDAAGVR